MAYSRQDGLKAIEVAAAVMNNTDPVSLTKVNFTKEGSAIYSNDADTEQSIPFEEEDIPLLILNTAKGPFKITWTTYDNDLQTLALLEGGTFTAGGSGVGDTYAPPTKTSAPVSLFVKATNKFNGGVKFFNAKISTTRNGILSRTGVPELNVVATAQAVDDTFDAIKEFRAPVA